MKKIIAILLFLLMPNIALALEPIQAATLKSAFSIGQSIGYPEIIQGIVYQETHCGLFKNRKNLHHDDPNIYNRYFGVMQIKIGAFKDVNRYFKLGIDLTPHEVEYHLQNDDRFNITIATLYIKYLMDYFDGDVDKTILAYNIGMSVVRKHGLKYDPYDYVNKVKKWIQRDIARFNNVNN